MPKISEKAAFKMLGEIGELYTDAEYACRQRRASRIIEAYAFFRGFQYRRRDFRTISTDELRGEEAAVVNICRPIVNASVADTLSINVQPRVPAAKDDQAARARADMTERLAQSFTRNGVLDYDEHERTVIWSKVTGAAWKKISWNPDAGRAMPDTIETGLEAYGEAEDRKPDFDPFGNVITENVYEGEIQSEFVSTIDGLPDPAARCKREIRHFFHRKLLPLRVLADMFPKDYRGESTLRKWDLGSRTTEQSAMANLNDEINSPLGYGQIHSALRSDANTFAEVVEFWELPSKRYPFGRFMVFSGKSLILAIGANPYTPARLPFVLYEGPNKTSGTLYPDGLLADIISLQRATNRVESKKLEVINKMANPHLMVPKNSGIEKNVWGDIPGQVIEYNKGYLPTPLPGVDVPQSMFTYGEDQLSRAKFITAHSDLAAGQVNAEASGRSVVFATENAQRQNAPERTRYENSIIDELQHCIWHVQQRYDDGRMVRTIGPNDDLELTEFFSDEFDFENDLAPVPFSDEPRSFAARVSTALELLAAGAFADTPDAERARRLIGGTYVRRSSYDPFEEDRCRARRENLYGLRNPLSMPRVMIYDIHLIHLEEHNKFRKSIQYERLPPVQKQQFDQHCDIHELLQRQAEAVLAERENLGSFSTAQQIGMGGQQQGQQGQLPPGEAPAPEQPQPPSPPNGGHGTTPAPPPTINEFANMSESERRASDQA